MRPASIRPAESTDLDRLVAIENEVFATDRISRRSFRDYLKRGSAALFVAPRHDAIVGYALASFGRGSRGARLYSIAVTPKAGRGVGRLLLAAAEAEALRRGCDRMRLEVDERNARAIRLYERAGYRPQGRREAYYEDGATALLYAKPLAAPHDALAPEQVEA